SRTSRRTRDLIERDRLQIAIESLYPCTKYGIRVQQPVQSKDEFFEIGTEDCHLSRAHSLNHTPRDLIFSPTSRAQYRAGFLFQRFRGCCPSLPWSDLSNKIPKQRLGQQLFLK